MDLKTAKIYCKLNGYKTLINKTNAFIEDSLSKVKMPYVACSFGKDSAVMLDLILKFSPHIPVRFASHPETRLLDNYDFVISEWMKKEINFEEIFCDGGLIKVKHAQRKALDALHQNWDSFFVGIRKEESFGRRVSLKKLGMFFKMKQNNRIKISPMANWKENDIATYVLVNNLPFLNKYASEGFSARTTSGIARTNIHETLNSLKQRDITSYNQLLKLFPDAKNFS